MFIQTDNFGFEDSFRCNLHRSAYSYPSHIHHFMELAVVLRGKIEIKSIGGSETVGEGDIALIPSFFLHSYNSVGECDVWIAVFSPSIVGELADKINSAARISFKASDELLAYAKARLLSADNQTPAGIKAALFAVAEEFLRSVPRAPDAKRTKLLPALFSYLAEHYREELSAEGVAAALGYSVSYLSHTLGSIPNMSFPALLANIRIDNAKKLLKNTELPISAVALECGFGCERSFHRAFAKIVGKTPREYKNK